MTYKYIALLGNFRSPYSSESQYANELEKMLDCVVWRFQEGEATGEEIEAAMQDGDYLFWVHTHGWKTPGKPMHEVLDSIRKMGKLSFSYHLDAWLGLARQKDMETEDYWKVDHFFTVDRLQAEFMNSREDMPIGHYLKAGVYSKSCYMAQPIAVEGNDIIFVGSRNYHPEHSYRTKLVDWLKRTYKRRFTHYGNDGIKVVRGDELNGLYASSKIVVGDSFCQDFTHPDYWSDRVYETLGRGGFLIHPYIPGMEAEFTDGEHLVFYKFGDFIGLSNKIAYYYNNPEERERIRKAGHELVKEKCTYADRLAHILDTLSEAQRAK